MFTNNLKKIWISTINTLKSQIGASLKHSMHLTQQRCRSKCTNLLHAKNEYLRHNTKESPSHPTDSARGLVEFSDTNTWQANLWSAGCFVMKPKYLQRREGKKIRHSKDGTAVSIDITFIC